MIMATALKKGTQAEALGKTLVQAALKGLGGKKPALGILFASSKLDLPKLVASVRTTLGNVLLLGCTTAGEFTETMVKQKSAALALLSASEDYVFNLSLATGLHSDPGGCVQNAVQAIPAPPAGYPCRSAILLHDGLAGRGEEAVLSATTILGPEVFFAGGAAADDMAFKQTCVICNDQITSDALVVCVIDSKKPVAIGVKHGHKPASKVLTVTKAKDNILYEVDGQPAWEVWKKLMAGEAKKIGLNVNRLKTVSQVGEFLIRYELGLSTGEEYKVRVPLSKNEDGSLNFACTIPEGVKFRIMKSPKKDQILSAAQSARNAMKQMGRTPIAGALVFDCVCRGLILGKDFYRGVNAVKKVIGKVPLLGFETYGEICRYPGQLSGLHNTTTVVMVLPA
jgi:methyl-accepting chemotaxis protein